MLSDPAFEYATDLEKQRLQKLWAYFKHNYEVIQQKSWCIWYPNRWFLTLGIPSPRQYITWEILIKMMGEEKFIKNAKMEEVSIYKNEIIMLKDKYHYLLDTKDDLKITIVCGSFWEGKNKCREKMMQLLSENVRKNKWKLVVYTQDKTLKNDFNSIYSVFPEIHWVPYRIDLHYYIIENYTNPEKSYVFLEFPHTEKFYNRLFSCFSFIDSEKMNCGKDKLLTFLKKQQKPHFFSKSLPSFFNIAFK